MVHVCGHKFLLTLFLGSVENSRSKRFAIHGDFSKVVLSNSWLMTIDTTALSECFSLQKKDKMMFDVNAKNALLNAIGVAELDELPDAGECTIHGLLHIAGLAPKMKHISF